MIIIFFDFQDYFLRNWISYEEGFGQAGMDDKIC
jgi:hypothetical protein